MRTSILFVLVFTLAALSIRGEPLPDELVKKLSTAVREHCPDAQVDVTNKVFTAKHGTMMFTMHNRSKTGEIYPETRQEEGPNFRGFVLTVSLETGRYQGAAMIPQTLSGPYFPTFIDGPSTEDGKNYYWVTFSYGSRLDEKVKTAILKAIPRSKDQATPSSSETNRTTR